MNEPPKLYRWYCWPCHKFSDKSYATEDEAREAGRQHAHEFHSISIEKSEPAAAQ